jgi:hypothetical protein
MGRLKYRKYILILLASLYQPATKGLPTGENYSVVKCYCRCSCGGRQWHHIRSCRCRSIISYPVLASCGCSCGGRWWRQFRSCPFPGISASPPILSLPRVYMHDASMPGSHASLHITNHMELGLLGLDTAWQWRKRKTKEILKRITDTLLLLCNGNGG